MIRPFLLFSVAALAQPPEFQLPPKQAFDPSMPRYPNVWFYIDARLASSHGAAVKLVTGRLRTAMRLPEYFPPFSNGEACDYEVRIEHLQPWIEPARPALQHGHAFHMRYYYSALAKAGLGKITVKGREFYRFAASAHYEVEHANPNHADVEACPICGRTGEYASLKGNLVELVHDPLGLELVVTGKIRGETVRFDDWERREVGSVKGMSGVRVTASVFAPAAGDRNTHRIGVVVVEPQP